MQEKVPGNLEVTVHSVTSNTLCDAHKLQKRSLVLAPSGFL